MKKLNLLFLGIGLFHSLSYAQSQHNLLQTTLNPSQMKYGSVLQLQCIARVDSKSSVYEIFNTCKNISSAIKFKPASTEPVLVLTNVDPQVATSAESPASAASAPSAAPTVAIAASAAASSPASESSFIAAAQAASDLAIQVNQILNSSATTTATAGYTLFNRDKKVKVLANCLLENGSISSGLDYRQIFLNCYSRALLAD